MTRPRFRLGIDFGTSTTVAVLRRPEGRVQQLLFDGSPLLSSAVLLGPDGRLHTGRDAAHLARSAPERLEPNPKRRADETTVLLGDSEVDVRDLIAAVLRRVAVEAARVAGPVDTVTLTHPADWGSGRRALLVEAARLAGFTDVDLVPEPVAAATYLAATQEVPAGSCVVVYDLGAGTCDVTLLRRHHAGFAQVASGGLNDLGGLDVDAAVVGFLQATYGTLWTDPATRRQLWDDVRTAKEMLSRASGTVVMIPALGREVPLGREQLEGLMRPVLRPSVAMTRSLLADAGVGRSEIAGLFLVGGSSRIPLVATMLHETLGIAPVVAEQPELVVAEGALPSAPATAHVAGADDRSVAFAELSDATVDAPLAPQRSDASAPQRSGELVQPVRTRRRSRNRLLAAAAAAVVVLAGTAVLISQLQDDGGQSPDGGGPSTQAVRYDLTKMPDDLCAGVDLTPFATLFETVPSPPKPTRRIVATGSEATCLAVRLHGTVRATFSTTIRVTPSRDQSAADYRMLAGDDAALNTSPEPLTGLGQEAVIFQMAGTTAEVKSIITFIVGFRDDNLTWNMRLTVDRQDQAGWTAAQRQQLRDKLVEVTRAAVPEVTAGVGFA
jgi:actin-like ATPase involved in cell morphogenesis